METEMKKLLLLSLVVLCSASSFQNGSFQNGQIGVVSAGADTTTGLIGWWKLDDGSGITATDSSVSANNGTLTGTPPSTWVAGRVGSGALSFVSASSQVVSIDPTPFDSMTKATLAGWINRTASGSSIAFGAGVGAGNRFNIDCSGDGNAYITFGVGNVSAYAFCALSGTGWHQVTVVFDGSLVGNARILFYVDGVAQTLTYNATPPATLATAANYVLFQLGNDSSDGFSNGSEDDIRIYNRALTAADVAALAAM